MPLKTEIARETPLHALLHEITPVHDFFVRHHAVDVPDIASHAYQLRVVAGATERSLRLAALRELPAVDLTATLVCAGNARTAFAPAAQGLPWGNGAISTAVWRGVRFSDILEGLPMSAPWTHAVLDGYDGACDNERPAFRRSIPIAKLLARETILAYAMNGEPISREHGGPARLIVGGWTANHSMKWLRTVTLAQAPDDGYWMTAQYTLPDASGTPVPVTTPPLRAIVAHPTAGERVERTVRCAGVAFGGDRPIARVTLLVDGVRTADAQLGTDRGPIVWRSWNAELALTPGTHHIAAVAADCDGHEQPIDATWNPLGYSFDGAHIIEIGVR